MSRHSLLTNRYLPHTKYICVAHIAFLVPLKYPQKKNAGTALALLLLPFLCDELTNSQATT